MKFSFVEIKDRTIGILVIHFLDVHPKLLPWVENGMWDINVNHIAIYLKIVSQIIIYMYLGNWQ